MEVRPEGILRSKSRRNASEVTLTLASKGKRRFEVVGEPWLDDTGSFYLARVDILDGRQEPVKSELQPKARVLFDRIPTLVQEWISWVLESNKASPEKLQQLLRELGPMPKDSWQDRAIWVGALVNPMMTMFPKKGVCLEIRPAMLACRNDHDRLVLASMALQSSIDHLSGKHRLF